MCISIAVCDDDVMFRYQIRKAVETYCDKKKIDCRVLEYDSVVLWLKKYGKNRPVVT